MGIQTGPALDEILLGHLQTLATTLANVTELLRVDSVLNFSLCLPPRWCRTVDLLKSDLVAEMTIGFFLRPNVRDGEERHDVVLVLRGDGQARVVHIYLEMSMLSRYSVPAKRNDLPKMTPTGIAFIMEACAEDRFLSKPSLTRIMLPSTSRSLPPPLPQIVMISN